MLLASPNEKNRTAYASVNCAARTAIIDDAADHNFENFEIQHQRHESCGRCQETDKTTNQPNDSNAISGQGWNSGLHGYRALVFFHP
jgi:hypothetical protein